MVTHKNHKENIMKKFLLVLAMVLMVVSVASAKDFTLRATVASWTDAAEKSFPVTFKLYDAATNVVLSSTTAAASPVTALAMPDVVIPVADNTVKKIKVYVTVTDAAGNASAKSPDSNEVTLNGIDTTPPNAVNTVNVIVTP
jgi:hypothetical protein